MRIYPPEDTVRKTPKISKNLYWNDEMERLFQVVAPKLAALNVPGIIKRDGSYNLSVVVNYLLQKEADETPNSEG